jgi:hypothetical protein
MFPMTRKTRKTMTTRSASDASGSALTVRETPKIPPRDIVTRTLSVRAESINEASRSVEATIATENPATVFDWSSYRLIDEVLLSRGAQLPNQVVMLENHLRWDLDTVLGSVRDMRIDGDQVVGRMVFADGDETAERAWQMVRQGHITDVSAGYRTIEFTDIKPNTTQRVNGKSYTAGDRVLRITTKWQIREASLVPIGADEFAKIREDRVGPNPENRTMNKKLKTYLESIGLRADATVQQAWEMFNGLEGERAQRAEALKGDASDPANDPAPPAPPTPTPSDGQRAAPTNPPANPAPVNPGAPPDLDAIRAEAARVERQRITTLRELASDDVPADLVQRACDEGWSEDRASREFLSAIRGARAEPVNGGTRTLSIHSRAHETDCTLRALSAGMMLRAHLRVVDPNASDRVRAGQERDAEQGERYRDLSMLDMCREALRISGQRVPHSRDEMIRASVSTGALSAIFTTTVNAQMMASFEEVGDTTVGWVREVDVQNFQSQERARFGANAALKKLPRGGMAEHVAPEDALESYKIARYANQFVVDEQDIVDDAFNALLDMPREMGAAARQLRPSLVYGILLGNPDMRDGDALFHANHGNLGTSGTALSADTLQAAIVAMGKQTEYGRTLNISPRYLIVPLDLKFDAMILLRSAQRIIAADSGGTYNPLAAEDIDLRADNRIGVSGVTDPATGVSYAGTATNYFLAASPSQGPTIEVGYLRGTGRVPMIRAFVLDQGQWGLGWDCKLDIGAKSLDWRGLYKATGAS